jgi:GDPmannose 4,6-dehydratase
MPSFTIQTNALGVLNMLEVYRTTCPNAKFYQASSSEMFGNSVDEDGVQRLSTPMNPVSPYGCSKVMGYNLVRHYRHAYKLHACNGILFNHESPRRGTNFVTNKVVRGAVAIKKGLEAQLELGNMDSYRDWGHSKDYVRAMHMIVNHRTPEEFIVATGQTHSVRNLCETVFGKLDLDYRNYVVQNPKYMRPEELKYLKGDSSKTREVLGWKPDYTFSSMIDEMIKRWEMEL